MRAASGRPTVEIWRIPSRDPCLQILERVVAELDWSPDLGLDRAMTNDAGIGLWQRFPRRQCAKP
jgi:hypothetical protein